MNREKTKLNSLDFPIRDIEYSPDGKKIAFIANTHDFYLANSDFTDKKLIDKNNRSVINSISWTMDSKIIFFSDNYLCRIQPDAINKPMLIDTLGSDSDVQCSKSENLLIYNANSNIIYLQPNHLSQSL